MTGLRLECHGDIAELVIDRPEKRNAMSYEMWSSVPKLAAEVDADESVKVLGGGCELALACDMRFADTTAEFAITPAKLGIVYSFDFTRLVAATGPAFAKYLLFSGNRVNAAHALRVGLVDELVDPADLPKITTDFAATIASRSQVSVRGAKRLIEKILAGEDAPDEEAASLPILAVESKDYREGVNAFLEKRPPVFRVR